MPTQLPRSLLPSRFEIFPEVFLRLLWQPRSVQDVAKRTWLNPTRKLDRPGEWCVRTAQKSCTDLKAHRPLRMMANSLNQSR